jgi:hypothetical protein
MTQIAGEPIRWIARGSIGADGCSRDALPVKVD